MALLAHPDQLARVRADGGLVATAIEEMIRYDSPLQLFERTAKEDVVLGDVTVPAGGRVAAMLGSANRDPAAFDGGRHLRRRPPAQPAHRVRRRACTTASAHRWPGWSCRSRCPRCCAGAPACT